MLCLVDVKDSDASSQTIGAYFEAKIVRITKVKGSEDTLQWYNLFFCLLCLVPTKGDISYKDLAVFLALHLNYQLTLWK